MDHTEQLRSFLDGPSSRFEIGPDAEHIDLGLGDVGAGAVLVVKAPTDALKLVAKGRIADSVDRDRTWEVVGFSFDRAVAETLLGAETTNDWLFDVPAAGATWTIIDRSDVL